MAQTIPPTPEMKSRGTRRPPDPRSLSPLGSAPAIARDSEGFALKMWQRYSLRLVPGHPVEPQMVLTTRPRNGLPMTLHPR